MKGMIRLGEEILQFSNYATNNSDNIIRVAAYCRVSSDHDGQLNSFNNQKLYYNELFKKYKNVSLIEVYAEENISGTNTIKRFEFNRMIEDAKNKRFDLIFTKEVSRFARNTIDTLQYTRKLKEYGVGVYFESDNIFTLDNDGELRLTIMSSLAQEESRKISTRVKWGSSRAMKNGVVFGTDKVLGFNIKNKKITVNEKEAKYVKLIYEWYKEGCSLLGVVKKLKEEGMERGKLGGKLTGTSIKSILRNEKYCGDLVQHKSTVEDYLTHKITLNKDKDSFIIVRNNHPAIIDRKTWNEVQLILDNNVDLCPKNKGRFKYEWGGKITCKECGSTYRRGSHLSTNGKRFYYWMCIKASTEGKNICSNSKYIREDILEKIMMKLFQSIIYDDEKNEVIKDLIEILEKNIKNSNVSIDIESIKKQLGQILLKKNKLLDLYMDDSSSLAKADYNLKNEEYSKIENELNKTLNKLENMNSLVEIKINKLKRFQNVVKEKIKLVEYEEYLVEEFLDKIIINKDKLAQIFLINDKYNADLSIKGDEKIFPFHNQIHDSLCKWINKFHLMSYNYRKYDVEVYIYA
jgi:site-specific DNA recombinase